jgi:NACHT NTPase-like protein
MASADVELITRIIATLGVATKHYNAVKDDKSLREAFHGAGRGLLLVQEALEATKPHLQGRQRAGDAQSAPLKACDVKAKLSEGIFKDVAQAPETSRFERYKAAVQQQGRGQSAEFLTIGMMRDVCNLAEESTIKAAMTERVKGLRDAIDKLSKMEPSIPNEGLGYAFNNFGPGDQFNAPYGTQNTTTGNGNQFPGASFSGPVSFGSPYPG